LKVIENGQSKAHVPERVREKRAPPKFLTSIYQTMARMGERRMMRVLVGKPEGKRLLEKHRSR
jgi:hypothetical protein